MPILPRKPSPKLTDLVAVSMTPDERLRKRRMMFLDWEDECAQMQEAFIEGLLAQMPSLNGPAS